MIKVEKIRGQNLEMALIGLEQWFNSEKPKNIIWMLNVIDDEKEGYLPNRLRIFFIVVYEKK